MQGSLYAVLSLTTCLQSHNRPNYLQFNDVLKAFAHKRDTVVLELCHGTNKTRQMQIGETHADNQLVTGRVLTKESADSSIIKLVNNFEQFCVRTHVRHHAN